MKRTGAMAALSKPLPSGARVNLSSFAFLFAELVSYHRARAAAISDLETRYVTYRLLLVLSVNRLSYNHTCLNI